MTHTRKPSRRYHDGTIILFVILLGFLAWSQGVHWNN